MSNPTPQHIGVLLAAGAGTRFGGAYPGAKLDQLIDGVSVGVRAFENLRAACDAVIVVVRDGDSALAAHARVHGATVLVAPNPDAGLGSSLAMAAAHCQLAFANASFLWATLADMPFIDIKALISLAQVKTSFEERSLSVIFLPQWRENPGASPQRGHPVGFGRAHWPALAALSGDQGARRVIDANAAHVVTLDTADAGVVTDIDTPRDLTSARRR